MSLYVPCYRPYNKHNTNIHALGGIRTHNPSKRAAEDPRLRPHGHWDRLDPRTVQPVASRHTDWAIAAHVSSINVWEVCLGKQCQFALEQY
jgi:hypothetical protein